MPRVRSLQIVLAAICVFLFATQSMATSTTITFDVTYDYAYNYSEPPLSVPFASTIGFTFDLSTHQDFTYSDGSATYRLLGERINSITVATDDYDRMPLPHIDWTPDQQGNVYILRDNASNAFKFVVVNSLSYSIPFGPYRRWHYFKAAVAESTFVTVDGYDPFDDPLRFLDDLWLHETPFAATLAQERWRRITSPYRDIYEGCLLQGSAVMATVTTPVPLPDSRFLFTIGILILIFHSNKAINKMN